MHVEEVGVDALLHLQRARARYGKLHQYEAHCILKEFDVFLSQSSPNSLLLVGVLPTFSFAFFARS